MKLIVSNLQPYQDTYTAKANLADGIRRCMGLFRPLPDLSVAQWADEYRYLSSESAAEYGKWHNDRTPYLIKPMELLSPKSATQEVVMCVSAQMGKTEILLNFLAYIVHMDPGPTLIVQPTSRPMAEDFSRERIAPMVRDTPVLKPLVADPKSRSSGNTVLHKRFPGGFCAVGGSNSPSSLAGRPIRYCLMDEIDRYPASSGTEGSPIKLAEKRTKRFRNKKILKVSSPTEKDVGIDYELSQCDTVYEWHLKCPECGEYQAPRWEHIHFDIRAGSNEQIAKTARYGCHHCGVVFGPDEEMAIKDSGRYIATREGSGRKTGFHFNQLSSAFTSWAETVIEWLESYQDSDDLRTFINTVLAEPYEDDKETLEDEDMFARRETYKAKIPDPSICVLVAGVDVQSDRFEMEVVGFNRAMESWGIERFVIYGDPMRQETQDELTSRIYQVYEHPSGKKIPVSFTGVDSGYLTDTVYLYTKGHKRKRVFAMKGQGGPTRAAVLAPTNVKIGMRGRGRVKLFVLGVDQIKEQIYKDLMVAEPGPRYCHFPLEYPPEYFDQLTAEEMIKRKKRGRLTKEWRLRRGIDRNEALDIRVYCYAGIKILNPAWDILQNKYKMTDETGGEEKTAPKPQKRRTRGRRTKNFVNDYR